MDQQLNVDEGFANVNGGRIYFKILNSHGSKKDGIPLFVIPGGPGFDHEIYEKSSGCFSKYTNVIFFDPRGTGKSQPRQNQHDYNLENYVEDAYALLRFLNISQCIILGISYGSIAALNLAIKYPTIIHKLILVSGAPSYHFLPEARANLYRRGTPEQISVGDLLFSGKFCSNEEVNNYFNVMSPLYSNYSKLHGIVPYKAQCTIELLNEAFRSELNHFDCQDSLKDIQAQTLIMFGKDDWITPISQAYKIAEGIKHNVLCIIKNAGHSVVIDNPTIYQALVSAFITIEDFDGLRTQLVDIANNNIADSTISSIYYKL